MKDPSPFNSDFPFSELGSDYASGQFTIDEITAAYGISRDTFFAIKKAAPNNWRKGDPPNYWWSDLDDTEETLTERAEQEAKAKRADRKAKQRQRREDRKAIRRWNRLEQAIEKASESFQNASYEPPKPRIRLANGPERSAGLVLNGQDWHVGKRPKGSEAGYHGRYVEGLKQAFERAMTSALNQYQANDLYVVTGGDLIHVDCFDETTTAGTPQDTLMGPAEALEEGVGLLRWVIDFARSLNVNVHVLPITGNHDKVLSQAAGIAVAERFHDTEDVRSYDPNNRIYFRHGEHLVLATHGDMYKKQWRKLPSLMMKEARYMLSETTYQEVISGHLHFQAQDLQDESGTLFAQTATPSPVDEWHSDNGYGGSRRGIQLLGLDPESAATSVHHEPVTT